MTLRVLFDVEPPRIDDKEGIDEFVKAYKPEIDERYDKKLGHVNKGMKTKSREAIRKLAQENQKLDQELVDSGQLDQMRSWGDYHKEATEILTGNKPPDS